MRGISPEKRKRIVHKWCSIPNISLSQLAKTESVSIGAVRNAIRKFGDEYSFEDAPKSGRKPGPVDRKMDRKIMMAFKNKKESSVRDVAKKLGTSKSNVQRAKVRIHLRTFKKQKQPKRSEKQAASVKPRARKLYDSLLCGKSVCIIMDDESYVKFDYKTLPGDQYYTVREGQDVDDADKSIFTEKFGKKAMVWQAICECGMWSEPFVTSETMKADTYIRECLNRRLLPMIRKHDGPVLFWPDLASVHYAKDTIAWYDNNEVPYVPKDMNPPNCPQARPIETFWALTKAYLRKHVNAADTIEKFAKDWKKVSNIVAKKSVLNLMRSVRAKVRSLAYD